MVSAALTARVYYAQDEVNNDGQKQDDGQHGGPESVIEPGLPSNSYRFRSPVVGEQGVYHGEHGYAGKQEGRDKGGTVAKVKHANGQGT